MKQVTIKDVAKAAGVSYSTVSRAMSGSPGISEATPVIVASYDGDGRLSAIEETFDGQSFTLGLSCDADGRLATFTLGGGSTDATFSYDEDGRFTEGLSNDGGGRYFYDSNGFVRESISYQTDSDLQIVGPVSYRVYHYPDEIQPLLGEYTTQFPDLQQ